MNDQKVPGVPPSDMVISVPPEQGGVGGPLLKDDGIVAVARDADARVAALERDIKAALRITSEWDWVKMGGGDDTRVYLTGSGAEKVARLFGIRWAKMKRERVEREDSRGPFYMWICEAEFTMGDDTIPEVGTCTSRDPFFAKRGQDYIPSEDVDEPSIMKAAVTNCVVRGVTGLIGLRNLPESFLPDKIGGKIAQVEYQSGTKGAGQKQDDDTAAKAKAIGNWLLELTNNDANAAMDELEMMTTFERDGKKIRGKRDLRKLTANQARWLYDKLEKDVQEHRAKQGAAQDQDAPQDAQDAEEPPSDPQGDQGKSEGQGDAPRDDLPF